MLRYWGSDLALEIASWFPFGVDYNLVSINSMHSPRLKRIAGLCLEMGSEFFFMTSIWSGCVGNLMRDHFYKDNASIDLCLGFMMLLGYSPQMEQLLSRKISEQSEQASQKEAQSGTQKEAQKESQKEIKAGVAFCSLWNKTLFLENIKVIALVSDNILFNEDDFLTDFESMFEKEAHKSSSISYFAEKFGYRRFCMAYETDDLVQLRISRLLFEMELPETRQMLGPSPEMPFPPFFGLSLSI